MDSREIIQAGLNYIECNLKTDISVRELADAAGFSLYHYYRVFLRFVGLPVQQYIIRRRLLYAIYEIGCGRKMLQAAYDYGFDTYAGFYKAFRREFSCSPSSFLQQHRAKKPYKIDLYQEEQIMMTHKRVAQMLAAWDLSQAEIADVYYEGTDRQNEHAYYVGDMYVLKISANLGQLKSHLEISKALNAAGIQAATPVLTAEQTEYIQDGELYACLTHRLEGEPLQSAALYRDTAMGQFLGQSLAKLHLALTNLDDITARDNDLLTLVQEVALPKAKDILHLGGDFCKDYWGTLQTLYPVLPRQLIHRDAHPGNILLKDGKAGFLDFDLSERNFRLYDPCYAATAILQDAFSGEDAQEPNVWLEIYRNIFDGYNMVSPLTVEEWEAAPYVLLANQFVCVSWFSLQGQYEDVFRDNVAMTNWLVQNFERLKLT